jgi:hypothetical protein
MRAGVRDGGGLLASEPEAAAALALVHAWMAEDEMFAGNPGPAAEHAARALAIEEANEPVAIMALHIRGDSRIALGDPGGIDDLHEALDRAQALGSVSEIVTSYSYIADREWQVGSGAGPKRLDGGARWRSARRLQPGSWSKVAALELLYELGRWDEMLTRALPLTNDERMDESLVVAVDIWTTLVHLRRGQPLGDVEGILARAREVEELQVLAPALALAALVTLAGAMPPGPRRSREFETVTRGKASMYRSESAVAVARLALAAGVPEVADDLVARSEPVTMRDKLFVDTAAAVVRESEGAVEPEVWADLERRWHAYGNVYEEAHAALARSRRTTPGRRRGPGDARGLGVAG